MHGVFHIQAFLQALLLNFRSSEVKLICDPSADTPLFTAYGDSEVQLTYVSQLHYFDLVILHF